MHVGKINRGLTAVLMILGVGVFAGCGGGGGSSDSGGSSATTTASSVVRTRAVATVPDCANGGIQVYTGIDRNGNGILDDGEIDASKTRTVCNGAPGAVALVRTQVLASGADCEYGGVLVKAGTDSNSNGLLDDSEVTSSQPICNGVSADAGTSTSGIPSSLTFNVTNVEMQGRPVVTFKLVSPTGLYVPADDATFTLLKNSLRFTLVKLVPGIGGAPDNWQSYINNTSGAGDSLVYRATAERLGPVATTVAGNTPTLISHGDGSYTYTFATDVTHVTTPLVVSYDASLTHRLAMQLGGNGFPTANFTHDFIPSGGIVTRNREIVSVNSCNQCHGQLTAHGSRIETKYCVTCHNPGTDVAPGVTVDFKVMVHRIHSGPNLPSVKAGTPYMIGSADFSNVGYPQDVRHCTKCHNGDAVLKAADVNIAEVTTQGDNWKTVPSRAACSSCHDNVDFATGANHGPSNLAIPSDTVCVACHSDTGVAGSVAVSHEIFAEKQGKRYAFEVTGVVNTAPGQAPAVTFRVTKDGVLADVLADAEWSTAGSSLGVLIGWDRVDYNNAGSGNFPGQPISISALPTAAVPPTKNADGTFTITSTIPIPTTAVGIGVAAVQGRVALTNPRTNTLERAPVKNAVKYFAITGTATTPRRTVVDIAACDRCHQSLSLHGGSRTDEPAVCVICHNSSATDISRRPASHMTNSLYDQFSAVGVDGKREVPIHFKTMIHRIHAAGEAAVHDAGGGGIVVYGYGNSVNDFSEVEFPGNGSKALSRCDNCHINTVASKTYTLPLPTGVLGTTVQTADPSLTDTTDIVNALKDQTDDLNISPVAATCSACHDRTLAIAHMEQNGAIGLSAVSSVALSRPVTQAQLDAGSADVTETCVVCHGTGRLADVQQVHGVPSP